MKICKKCAHDQKILKCKSCGGSLAPSPVEYKGMIFCIKCIRSKVKLGEIDIEKIVDKKDKERRINDLLLYEGGMGIFYVQVGANPDRFEISYTLALTDKRILLFRIIMRGLFKDVDLIEILYKNVTTLDLDIVNSENLNRYPSRLINDTVIEVSTQKNSYKIWFGYITSKSSDKYIFLGPIPIPYSKSSDTQRYDNPDKLAMGIFNFLQQKCKDNIVVRESKSEVEWEEEKIEWGEDI